MPEGHVIHRLAREFNRDFTGRALTATSPQGRFSAEAALIDGHRLIEAEAHGKHLFMHFDNPEPEHIVYIHLGLIGQLRFEPNDGARGQIRLRLDNGTVAAHLRGPQWCRLITEEDYAAAVAKIGADPLRADADPESIRPKIARSRRSIGSLLMDQKLYAGVGNIYRAETLFRQGVSPFTPGKEVTDAQFDGLWEDLVEIMTIGAETGQIDTVRADHMPEQMGRAARDDEHGGEVYVYRRAGLDCYVCGAPVRQQVMEGRNLFWCPRCQPE
ncbi:formamidopyrimidine-DNA glycosylase [Corynebacterium maris DSM 45190]|uniref:DNA-(apurinic or apyrimidinic site) lyase n=1 Tax=Corynebacterium maris DSM 45190 TaxID=1224163 RepID=S5TMA3_9CORY|nr:DNA-formamidopyrimidine glycosylase family protein [Corynebacterium maris]AGS35951.1 formamidopyrimidine-DNA glycosylase [Corynebacterium maris DSM 45190]